MGLNLAVVTAARMRLVAAVASAYARQEPVLFFYEPRLFSQFELTRVRVSAYGDDCCHGRYGGGVACYYPPMPSAGSSLPCAPKKARVIYALLERDGYDNDAQITMLGIVVS
ncbi:MAG: hypothetical protein IPL28_26765 [Chloroflexi bacterium]|nr:hypothetical protein [Chloroflexota bacterium]